MPASSLAALVAANLLPLAGVAFWGWQVGDVVMLYWAENLVVGAFNVLRMAIAKGEGGEPVPGRYQSSRLGELGGRVFIIGFFIVHYGMFCYVHGSFLAHLFPPTGIAPDQEPFVVLRAMMRDGYALAALAAIVASHGFSFAANYLGRGEYRGAGIDRLMMSPYKRIVFTHVFILAGAFLLLAIGSPLVAMLLFVALKIGFDARAHVTEHRAPASPVTA
ncbi:MAG: DUF6498-containing protein [Burkholderiales bacterium]